MQVYNYKARDQQGKVKVGFVEAPDSRQAAAAIREHGLVVISITPKLESLSVDKMLGKLTGVSGGERVVFTRMLATMLTTGLPLSDALSNLRAQATSQRLKEVIDGIIRDVQGGSALSGAMARYPDAFNDLYVNLMKAGEASGRLDQTLIRLADTLEKQQEFNSKIKGALIYPVIIVFAMVGVSIIMIMIVIPKISVVYKEFGADLPLPTMILITVSNLIINFWWAGLLIIFGTLFALRAFKATPSGEYIINNLSFKLPVLGSLNREVSLATFSRTLGTLVGSGISILEALRIVGETIGNNVYRKSLEECARQVEKGFPLSFPLRASSLYPTIVSQLVAVGEETGSLDQSLDRLAVFFEGNAERKVKTLTTAIEPMMIIVMGVGVAGLAIAVLMPMFNMVNVIK